MTDYMFHTHPDGMPCGPWCHQIRPWPAQTRPGPLLRRRQRIMVRKAAAKLPQYKIGWAVIAPDDHQPGGWDYHLIPVVWGHEAALRLHAETGGWIMKIKKEKGER